jgi:hypothetical protein
MLNAAPLSKRASRVCWIGKPVVLYPSARRSSFREPQDIVQELRVALTAYRGAPLHLIIHDHTAEPGLTAWIAAELR